MDRRVETGVAVAGKAQPADAPETDRLEGERAPARVLELQDRLDELKQGEEGSPSGLFLASMALIPSSMFSLLAVAMLVMGVLLGETRALVLGLAAAAVGIVSGLVSLQQFRRDRERWESIRALERKLEAALSGDSDAVLPIETTDLSTREYIGQRLGEVRERDREGDWLPEVVKVGLPALVGGLGVALYSGEFIWALAVAALVVLVVQRVKKLRATEEEGEEGTTSSFP